MRHENLSKETPCQVALGQLENEVSRMPDETLAGLEQALLQARQRPVLDGERQDQPTQEIAEVVGDDPEQQADSLARKPWQERRVQWVAALPSLIHCSAVPRWL
jgi:hypothetical protein